MLNNPTAGHDPALPEATARPPGDIHYDAVTLAAALSLIDRMTPTTGHDQAEFFAIIALVAPFARKLADDLEEVL
jgi:hypothetical protein